MKDYFIELGIAVGMCTAFYVLMKTLVIWFGPFDTSVIFSIGMFAGLMAESVIKNRQMKKLLELTKQLKGE